MEKVERCKHKTRIGEDKGRGKSIDEGVTRVHVSMNLHIVLVEWFPQADYYPTAACMHLDEDVG